MAKISQVELGYTIPRKKMPEKIFGSLWHSKKYLTPFVSLDIYKKQIKPKMGYFWSGAIQSPLHSIDVVQRGYAALQVTNYLPFDTFFLTDETLQNTRFSIAISMEIHLCYGNTSFTFTSADLQS